MTTVGVFAAIFDHKERILCVKQNYSLLDWALPGGRMEDGESPTLALEREVQEETGYLIKVARLIGIYATPYKNDLALLFEARIVEKGLWNPNNEISDLGFYYSDELPQPMHSQTLRKIQDTINGSVGVVRVFKNNDDYTKKK